MTIPPKHRLTVWIYLGIAAIALFWVWAEEWGWLRSLEEQSVDARFRARGSIEASVRVVYVDLDTQALRERGNFPWDRSLFRRLCEGVIREGGARAVGVDVVFSNAGIPNVADLEKVRRGSEDLGSYLLTEPPVVMAASYAGRGVRRLPDGGVVDESLPTGGRVGAPPELPVFDVGGVEVVPPRVGLIDTLLGDTRRVPMFARTSGRDYLSFALELARLYWGLENGGVRILEDRIVLTDADGRVAREVPLDADHAQDVNWFSRWQDDARNPRVSAHVVLLAMEYLESGRPELVAAGREFFDDGFFRDAVVLIGPVDPLLQDLAPTPFDVAPVPKVGVHGNFVKTLVSGRYLNAPPGWAAAMIFIGLTLATAGLFACADGRRSALCKLGGGLLLVGYVAGAFWVFARHDYVLPLAGPTASATSAALFALAARLAFEQKQKTRIQGLFGAYLAPALVKEMVEAGREPTLGGVEAEITAYFSDVQNFSTFSEALSPARLVELMNEYLTACTDIVQAEGGTLDKYIGDAVVAMFGAPLALPDHAARACVAALRVQRRCAELRAKWRQEVEIGRKAWPAEVLNLRTRIGLNTGLAVVGNMGSKSRFNYTMTGDTVNLAARMESGAKTWGVYTLCADPTRRACEAVLPGKIVFREIGSVVVKGRTRAVPIHELVGFAEEVDDRAREALALFARGLELYRAQDWDGALAAFGAAEPLEPNQPKPELGMFTNPSRVYLRITSRLRENPPGPEWDGAYHMTEK